MRPEFHRCLRRSATAAVLAVMAALASGNPLRADPGVTVHTGPNPRLAAEIRTVVPGGRSTGVVRVSNGGEAGSGAEGVTVVRGARRTATPRPSLAAAVADLCRPAPTNLAALADGYFSEIARSP